MSEKEPWELVAFFDGALALEMVERAISDDHHDSARPTDTQLNTMVRIGRIKIFLSDEEKETSERIREVEWSLNVCKHCGHNNHESKDCRNIVDPWEKK